MTTPGLPATMRAAQLDSYGSAQDISVRDVPVRAITSGQVLVRVRATSVNGGELLMLRGALRPMSGGKFPKGLGIDFSGTVVALGAAVTDLRIGDRVWGLTPSVRRWRSGVPGAAAEFLAVGREHVQRLPPHVALTEAASLPVVGPTAVRVVDVVARVTAGEDVLVRGAAGGVGSMLVQLAHSVGARVTALASAGNAAFVAQLGADSVLDYRTTAAADLPRYDVVLDAVGSDLSTFRRLLRPGGRMVAVALDPAPQGAVSVAVSRVHGSRRIRFSRQYPGPAEYDALAAALAAGRCRPVIAARYRIDDVAAAYQAAERGGVRGKQLIEVEVEPEPSEGLEEVGDDGAVAR